MAAKTFNWEMAAGEHLYSCRSASETLEWIHAIIDFLRPYRFFFEANVVNFFKDRMWEAVDKEWIDCLRNESIDNLLQIPSGAAQDHWPASLKEFVLAVRSLTLPREQADLQQVLPNLQVTSFKNILTQGMNQKKKHEVELLAAVVHSVARDTKADTIVDVGAGQGYLSQVLSFQYQHSVIAIDACSHHGKITSARAERINKHYAAKMRKTQDGNTQLRLEDRKVNVPKTVTCHLLSTDSLKDLTKSFLQNDEVEQPTQIREDEFEKCNEGCFGRSLPLRDRDSKFLLLLAGLHACGDLSVTMLRTFLESEEVRAVVSIGCCYNLLSEEGNENSDAQCGFPMSKGVKNAGLLLGRSARDLACQSAARWRGLGKDAGLHNFELHALRAAFQMVLFRYYPEILVTKPTIGRQGKALRRQQHRRTTESTQHHEESIDPSLSLSQENSQKNCGSAITNSNETGTRETIPKSTCTSSFSIDSTAEFSSSSLTMDALIHGVAVNQITESEMTKSGDKFKAFEQFSHSGLSRLHLQDVQDIDLARVWRETEPFSGLIGPYWSLRAALGPVVETVILLDRLLYLQEQQGLEVVMLPIFDPAVSPRNVAIIAQKL